MAAIVPLVLHHLSQSRSQRIVWLFEELKVPYTITRYERVNGLAPPQLYSVHPLGKAPVVCDGDLVLAESGAIIEYVNDKFGTPFAKGTKEAQMHTYWLHFAEGSLMTPLLLLIIFKTVREKVPWVIRPIINAVFNQVENSWVKPNLKGMLTHIESHLQKNDYFCGSQFSMADVQMEYPVNAAFESAGGDVGEKTKLWLKSVQERPAYKEAKIKGGD